MMKTSKNDLTALTEASDNHQHSEEAEVGTMFQKVKTQFIYKNQHQTKIETSIGLRRALKASFESSHE